MYLSSFLYVYLCTYTICSFRLEPSEWSVLTKTKGEGVQLILSRGDDLFSLPLEALANENENGTK